MASDNKITACDVSRLLVALSKNEGCDGVRWALDDFFAKVKKCNDCHPDFYRGEGGFGGVVVESVPITGLEPLVYRAPKLPTALDWILPKGTGGFNPPAANDPVIQMEETIRRLRITQQAANDALSGVEKAGKYRLGRIILRFPVVRAMVTSLVGAAFAVAVMTAIVEPALERGLNCQKKRKEECESRKVKCNG